MITIECTSMNNIISSKQTALFIFVLFVITSFSLFVALTPQSATMEVTPIAPTPTPAVQTMLFFDPQQMQIKPGNISLQKSDISMDTGANNIHLVQLELGFDPKVIENIDITAGTFLSHPTVLLKNIDYASGRISFAASSDNISGKGIVATLSFSIIPGNKQKQTIINFLPKTSVGDKKVNTSVLKKVTPLVLFLTSQTPTP